MLGNVIDVDGLNYIRMNYISLMITVQNGSVELRNLFGGDKNLGEYIECCRCDPNV